MKTTNRTVFTGICSILILTIAFYVLIISAIIGRKVLIELFAIIVYAASALILANTLLEEKFQRVKFFVMVEALQLIPYIIILVIRELL